MLFAESVPAIFAKRPRSSGQTTRNSVVPDSGKSITTMTGVFPSNASRVRQCSTNRPSGVARRYRSSTRARKRSTASRRLPAQKPAHLLAPPLRPLLERALEGPLVQDVAPLLVQLGQEHRLPLGPDLRRHLFHVRVGKQVELVQPGGRSHGVGEGEDQLDVVQVAPLRYVGHQEMLLHEEDQVRYVLFRESPPGADPRHDLGADPAVALPLPLPDVVKQDREVEQPGVPHGRVDPVELLLLPRARSGRLDLRQNARAADGVDVHRVDVIDVPLHLAVEGRELGDVPGEEPALVHGEERLPQMNRVGENLEEELRRLPVLAERGPHGGQRQLDVPPGLRGEDRFRLLHRPEELEDPDRLLLEGGAVLDLQLPLVEDPPIADELPLQEEERLSAPLLRQEPPHLLDDLVGEPWPRRPRGGSTPA